MTIIELIWTITPALILIAIAFPSFRLLYLLDEVTSPTVTIKVTGHQWYWSTLPFILNFKKYSHKSNFNLNTFPYTLNKYRLNYFTQFIKFHSKLINKNSRFLNFQSKARFIGSSRYFSTNHDKTFSILEKGINHSSISTKVKIFLKESQSDLMLKNQLFNIREEAILPYSFKFDSSNETGSISEIRFKAGIYKIRLENQSDFYIGSATDLYQRFIQHRNKSRKLSRQNLNLKLYKVLRGIPSYFIIFEVLEFTTNFIYKFRELYPDYLLNENEIELMHLISLYECTLKENKYLEILKPNLNTRLFSTISTRLSYLENNIINPKF